ncbi:MAG: LUD domain-containing protein [Chloroflexales bacterium]|nr:LUD domain-containing protein [Chloroflexales bacterium]
MRRLRYASRSLLVALTFDDDTLTTTPDHFCFVLRHSADIFDSISNLHLITGPSRTIDIEMTLTLGIHGPKEIHVLVV